MRARASQCINHVNRKDILSDRSPRYEFRIGRDKLLASFASISTKRSSII